MDVVPQRGGLNDSVGETRKLGLISELPLTLTILGNLELRRGHYREASAHASEGLALARETGQNNTARNATAALAVVAAVQGRDDECRSLANEALQGTPHAPSAVIALTGLALLDLGRGNPAAAFDRFESLPSDSAARRHPITLYRTPDLVEAAVRTGQAETARPRLEQFDAWATATGSPSAQALSARCHALLANGEGAVQLFETALTLHEGTDNAFEQARTALLYGEYLRRIRKRLDARTHLRSAADTFATVGATPWEERALRELRATGEKARRRDPSTRDQLTPQELQIAQLVAGGASNKEVAAQLFLSPKTVEYHLRKGFQKLGLTSRLELSRAFDSHQLGAAGRSMPASRT